MTASFDRLWNELEPLGREASTGGYRRYAFNAAELECREWFTSTAQARGLEVETDRNGNLWAWWIPAGVSPELPALVVGSHLDSVPDGGAFDGPLGVVSSFAAIDALRETGAVPTRPVVLAAFADEEGARFGVACAGSRLMTGQLDPDKARALVARDGPTMAEAMSAAGHDPRGLGADPERVARIGEFIELHIEQGRGLVEGEAAVGVAESIWPHGRYRFTFRGVADHAGSTRMSDRHDPMLAYARTALIAAESARSSGSRATFGRLEVEPNGTNAIPSEVRAWLDARACDETTLDALVEAVHAGALEGSRENGTDVDVTTESVTAILTFDASLRDRVRAAVDADQRVDTPVLPTAAGHDAGILAGAGVPTAMLFVRNPTGISHSPNETAEADDCHAGVSALTAVMRAML
ncbi:MAG: allantoate amidohydrolase [Actinomycetes bacterium]